MRVASATIAYSSSTLTLPSPSLSTACSRFHTSFSNADTFPSPSWSGFRSLRLTVCARLRIAIDERLRSFFGPLASSSSPPGAVDGPGSDTGASSETARRGFCDTRG